MSVLSDEVKMFLVQSLACFDTPKQAVAAVKERFDLVLDRRQVQKYDPTNANGNDELGEALKAVFFETRKRFLEQVADIGVAHKVVRLRRLDRYRQPARRPRQPPRRRADAGAGRQGMRRRLHQHAHSCRPWRRSDAGRGDVPHRPADRRSHRPAPGEGDGRGRERDPGRA